MAVVMVLNIAISKVQYSTLLEVVQLHLTPGPITNGVTMIESILKYRIMAEVAGLL